MKLTFKLSLAGLRRFFLVLLIVFVSGSVGYLIGNKNFRPNSKESVRIDRTVPADKPLEFSLFWQVWDDLNRLYVDRINLNSTNLIYGAIQGMVGAAGDPYTIFLTPQQNKESKEDLSGSFGGVGIELGYKDRTLAVIAPVSGSPAEKAGVQPGDLILKITDPEKKIERETESLSLPEAVSLIRGQKGSDVTLMLARKTIEKPFEVTLKRDTIVVKTVELKLQANKCLQDGSSDLIDCTIPVIKVSRFGEKTDLEWDKAVAEIQRLKKEVKYFPGIVLDLRNDPGGFLDQAVNLASDFITSGPVVWQQNNNGEKTSYAVSRTARLAGMKLVIVINEGSASAAEILAGALDEKADATLVASQKSIDKVGILPEVEIKNDDNDQTNDKQLLKAIELLTNINSS
ncbi:MAG: Carboxyl-terminal protease [Microgenomates group bacterium GW2011_GWA2_44_7]|nr:MAG: Carboxyl-terminal protease [Microgenomates group bacterium GW2011_GWA2_44_7]